MHKPPTVFSLSTIFLLFMVLFKTLDCMLPPFISVENKEGKRNKKEEVLNFSFPQACLYNLLDNISNKSPAGQIPSDSVLDQFGTYTNSCAKGSVKSNTYCQYEMSPA
ncbi:hypothetical protein L2E82_51191 [Cichorium intybus]|nr:hypothetical protein L2E82_51191 [Cichorium intybus]